MDPEELIDFLDYVKDIRGYLVATLVEWPCFDEKILPYLTFLSRIGEEEVYPDEFYEALTEMYSVLGLIMSIEPRAEAELYPCIKVIDQLRNMFRVVQ